MKRQILFTLLILLVLAPQALVFAQEEEPRPLEVVYPNIPGIPVPTNVETALPEYAQYIFRFALLVIGFIIFGILVYNGFIYMTSTGSPGVMGEARNGILAAIFGIALLLGAWLIFNTINPQLVTLETEPLDPLKPIFLAGIYVCVDGGAAQDIIALNLQSYIEGDRDIQVQAVKNIKEAMIEHNCLRLAASGNFQNFTVKQEQNTFFAVPGVRVNPENQALVYDVYEYGLILHEKDGFRGRALLVEPPYAKFDPLARANLGGTGNFPALNFESKSFTLFKKVPDPLLDEPGATLFACINYNEPPYVCEEKGDEQISSSFQTAGGDTAYFREAELQTPSGALAQNTRSIQVAPVDSMFALLFSGDNFTFDPDNPVAEVVKSNNRNLLNNPIGRCGGSCWFVFRETEERQVNNCIPCTRSMIVIKGRVL